MELLVVAFVFITTIRAWPAEAFLFRSVQSLQPEDFTDNADQKTAPATAHLLTGASGYRVDIEFDESNADNFLLKREAIGPSGFKRSAAESLEVDEMSNDQSILGKSEAIGPSGYKRPSTESLEVDVSNTDHIILGKSEALGPSGYKRSAAESLDIDGSSTNHIILGKSEAIGPTGYKRSAAEPLEVDESNSDHIILGKSEAPGNLDKRALAGPTASRHRAASTSMEAE